MNHLKRKINLAERKLREGRGIDWLVWMDVIERWVGTRDAYEGTIRDALWDAGVIVRRGERALGGVAVAGVRSLLPQQPYLGGPTYCLSESVSFDEVKKLCVLLDAHIRLGNEDPYDLAVLFLESIPEEDGVILLTRSGGRKVLDLLRRAPKPNAAMRKLFKEKK